MDKQKWAGSSIGATNRSETEREQNDYYATHPNAVEDLLDRESFNQVIYEPAVGEGHIANALTSRGYKVLASDIIDRGYKKTKIRDFLTYESKGSFDVDIITNPPYKYASEFLEKSIDVIKDGNRVAMFLKLSFLEGQARKKMFAKYPPKYVYVFSKRPLSAKNGKFTMEVKNKKGETKEKLISGLIAYAWFVWEKGFKGEPIIRWI